LHKGFGRFLATTCILVCRCVNKNVHTGILSETYVQCYEEKVIRKMKYIKKIKRLRV